jgi:hypothetical protein
MGLKKRAFDGTLRTAILEQLDGGRLSRGELLARLRQQPRLAVSNDKLAGALGKLLDRGKIVMEGQRAAARFRRARPL